MESDVLWCIIIPPTCGPQDLSVKVQFVKVGKKGDNQILMCACIQRSGSNSCNTFN